MATKEKIFEFDATQSIDNLRNLRAEIAELKDDLEQLEIGSEAYREVSAKLAEQQYRLNEIMGAQKDAVKALKPTIQDAEGSFNALNKELASLKEQWKATGDEMTRAQLTEKINAVKGKMNEMNESIGNYQHNVGNYTNSIIDAFGKMGISVESLTAPLKKIGVDVEGMGKTIKTVGNVVKGFSGTNLKNLANAFSGATDGVKTFIAGLNGIQKAILATGIGALIVAIGTLIANWDEWFNATKDEVNMLGQLEVAIADAQYEMDHFNMVLNYHLELKKLQGATDLELLEYQETVLKQERELILHKIDEAEANYALIESEDALAKQREYMATLQAQLEGVTTQLQKTRYDWSLAYYKKQHGLDKKTVASTKTVVDEVKKAHEELLKFAEQEADKELENFQKAEEIRLQAIEDLKTEKQKEIESYNKQKAELEAWGLDTEDLEKAHAMRMKEILQAEVDAERQKAEDIKAAKLAQIEFEEEMRQKKLEIEDTQNEGVTEDWQTDFENTVARNNAEFDAAKALNDSKIALNQELMLSYEETSEEYQALLRENETLAADTELARAKRDKANADAYDKLMKKRAEATKSMVTSTSNLLKQASQAMGENSKAAKGFAVASATIDTIAAALAGFRAGYNQWKDAPGPLAALAPIQGAINAAAALAAGYAQVKQIMSVDPSGSNAGGAASSATALAMPNIEGLNAPMDYTRQVTTDTEKEELNRDNRVYILESDIQDSGRRVRVREEETTF